MLFLKTLIPWATLPIISGIRLVPKTRITMTRIRISSVGAGNPIIASVLLVG